VMRLLKDFKCGECSLPKENEGKSKEAQKPATAADNLIQFKSIGLIRTIFNEKRAIPRQANIAETILSKVEIRRDLFSNADHCLERLDDFSHVWLIYNFHKNDSHAKPKVYPPRLDGKNVGVYATRSPHRPNSIGMSLVKLDRIEGTTIYFYGTDMLDSTPVLDIKPFIPSYDSPQKAVSLCDSPSCTPIKTREEPEGEEEHDQATAANYVVQNDDDDDSSSSDVKVPKWVSDSRNLKVIFSDNAVQQIQALGVNQKSIEEILQSDPRSVYVREKYLSQIYSFQIDGKNVICRFDDKSETVTVLQVRNLMEMSDE
jgi:tRNA-Thr(GGU) m(6)t(6)A37 methyltransferase TsaA